MERELQLTKGREMGPESCPIRGVTPFDISQVVRDTIRYLMS